MYDLGTIGAAVTLDTKSYEHKLAGMEKNSELTFKRMAVMAATYLSGREIVRFADRAITSFSDLQETASKFSVVFSSIPEEAKKAALEIQNLYGQSERSAKQMIGDTGDLLAGFGFDQKTSLDLSTQVTRLSVDLASFQNYAGGAKGAALALTRAMLGETEQAKMLGIVIRQGTKDYQDRIEKLQKEEGYTLLQAKAYAALQIATEQSKNSIGDYSRTMMELANSKRRLGEVAEDFNAKIGEQLAGAANTGVQSLTSLLTAYNKADQSTRQLINNSTLLAGGLLLLQTNAGKAANAALISAPGKLGGFFNESAKRAEIELSKQTRLMKEAEGAAHAAVEKQKAASTASSIATRDALEKNRHLRAMQNAAKEAAATLKAARAKIKGSSLTSTAQTVAYQKTVTLAEQEYAEAKKKVVVANQAFVASSKAAKVAKEAENAATYRAIAAKEASAIETHLAANAQKAATSAMSIGSRTATMLAGGFNAAGRAAVGFIASIGPIGWAMIGITAISAIINKINGDLEKAAQEAADLAQEAANANSKIDEANQKRFSQLARLEKLASYERLNNREMNEANDLLQALELSSMQYGIRLDENTGKLIFQRKTLKELTEEKKKAWTQEKIIGLQKEADAIMNQINANDEKKADGDRTYWRTYLAFSGSELYMDSVDEINTPIIKENNKLYAKRFELLQKIALYKSGKINIEKNEDEIAAANEKLRDLQDKVTNKKWQIKFNASEATTKLNMLDQKIKSVTEKKFQTRGDEEKSLLLELEILDLTDKRGKLEKQIAEQRKRDAEQRKRDEERLAKQRKRDAKMLADMLKSFNDLIAGFNRKDQAGVIDRAIDYAVKNKDFDSAQKIALAQYQSAKQQAEDARARFAAAYKEAAKDKVLTEEERKMLEELKQKYLNAKNIENKYANKYRDTDTKKKQDLKDSVTTTGAFGGMLLEFLGGRDSAQDRTAQATEAMERHLEYIKRRGGLKWT
jgi:hypothetical protein